MFFLTFRKHGLLLKIVPKKFFMKTTILLVSIAFLAFKNSFYNDKTLKNSNETTSYLHEIMEAVTI